MALQIGTATSHSDLFDKLRAFLVLGSNATGTLTLTGNAADTETVTIDAKVYTFQATLTNVDGNVLVGASASASIDNLVAAIMLDPGAGTLYATATTVHPTAYARQGAGDTLVVMAKTAGTAGNSLATTETLGAGSWADTSMNDGGVNPWVELRYDSTNKLVNFEAPGLSGTDEIHVGLGYVENVGTDAYALTGWMFQAYNSGLGYQSQPGNSAIRYQPVWNSTMPYWFIANGQRVIVVTKVSTVYTSSYIGKFLPYGTPGEYPQPYYLGMSVDSNIRWSSGGDLLKSFFDPTSTGAQILLPSGSWANSGNWTATASSPLLLNTSAAYVWPYNSDTSGQIQASFLASIRDNIDGSYALYPLRLVGDSPSLDWYGELQGAYCISGFGQASEDVNIVDGARHLVVQDVNKTGRHNYAALLLE